MSPRRASSTRRAAAILVGLSAGLVACGGTPAPTEFWRPWYELAEDTAGPAPDLADSGGRSDGGSGGADQGAQPVGCSLAVSVTTTSAGGRYAPRNIGAIWISDGSDRFIKTLSVWADKRAKYLRRWNEVTAAAGRPASRVDAVSSATKTSHGARSGAWGCTDTAGVRVPDGPYKVCFELTDYDGPGRTDCVAFSKGPAPLTLTPADAPSFTARRLEYSP